MISIIITSYNQEKTMKLLLQSLEQQTCQDFEVIVADDGSKDGTSHLVAQKREFPIQWVTQEDLGYRKAKILNSAIRKAQSDYLIFLDADVVLERHFVEDHLALRKKDHFVCGRRVDLGPRFCADDLSLGTFERLSLPLVRRLAVSSWQGDSQGVKRALRLPGFLRRWLGYDRPLDILGSNLGVWKSDLYQINGFNEALQSYWGEDGDLFIRLRNAGKIAIGAKGICIQFHIFHPRRPIAQDNVRQYEELLKNTEYKWATEGLAEKI